MRLIPAVFELDDDGEATGQVQPFCSYACRDAFRSDPTRVRNLFGYPDSPHAFAPSELSSHLDHICIECKQFIRDSILTPSQEEPAMSKGIDYGMGTTNIDRETGIRYGVINQHEVLQAWCDSSEGDYGEPHCPECGNEAVDGDSDIDANTLAELADEYRKENPDTDADVKDMSRDDFGYECKRGACGDYACDSCRILFDGEDAFGDEPLGHVLDDGEYRATAGQDGDIFILSSPYYTRAQFCSPCAPGACYLTNPCDDGEKAYCFGHDWFDDGVAPYPVYSVKTNELVNP